MNALWLERVLFLACLVSGCTGAHPRVAGPPDMVLRGTDGRAHSLIEDVKNAKLTTVLFFSATCPCVRLHDARLRALDSEYRARGVQMLMVDSEARAALDSDAAEAARRGYRFPILVDPKAKLADALGADYATYVVVFDRTGRIRYSGGIDTDRAHLHPDATPFLRQAIDSLLDGREPPSTETHVLGCALEK